MAIIINVLLQEYAAKSGMKKYFILKKIERSKMCGCGNILDRTYPLISCNSNYRNFAEKKPLAKLLKKKVRQWT